MDARPPPIHLSKACITKAFPVTSVNLLIFITGVNHHFAFVSKQNILPVIMPSLSVRNCPVSTSSTMVSCKSRTIVRSAATYASISEPTSDSLSAYSAVLGRLRSGVSLSVSVAGPQGLRCVRRMALSVRWDVTRGLPERGRSPLSQS